MLTINLIKELYIPFALKALQEPKSMLETVQQSCVGRIIPKKKIFKLIIKEWRAELEL